MEYINTRIPQNISQVDLGQAPLLFPFASSVLSIGQMTNNRQGVILNTDLKFGRNKFTIGYSAANEISALSNKITYGHPANNIALSRFWRWGFLLMLDHMATLFIEVYMKQC